MPEYQIEMLWRCRVCMEHRVNRGLAKHCSNCGHPKDDQDEEMFPEDISEANALTGEDKRKALAGEDWKCKFCSSLQSALNKCCTECGADMETGARVWLTKELSITQDVETGKKSAVKARKTKVNKNVSTRAQKEDILFGVDGDGSTAEQGIPETKIRFKSQIPWHKILIGAAAVSLISLLVWVLFRTKTVDAHVTQTHWEHKVLIDRYQVYNREGWSPEPGAFNIVNEGRRIHHYDHVKTGSHTERYTEKVACGQNCTTPSCYTTSRTCTSNKNGTANCSGGDRVCPPPSCTTKYCDEPRTRTVDDYEDQPRYQDWYAWSVWDWGYNRTVRHSGETFETDWPSEKEITVPLAVGEKERSHQEEEYTIVFTEPEGATHEINPKTESEFRQYPIGRVVKLKVGIVHGVEVLP